MSFEDRRYVIFSVDEVSKVVFSQVMETSESTLRKSVDGTKTFVKYDSEMPESVSLLTSKSVEYNHDEIMNILRTEEWQPADDI